MDTKNGIVKLSNTLDPLMPVPLKNVGPLLIRFKIIPTNKAVLNESIRISGDKVCFAKEVKRNGMIIIISLVRRNYFTAVYLYINYLMV